MSEQPKWTPGPWVVDRFGCVSSVPEHVQIAVSAGDFGPQRLANERLLAAAPELYEACDLALKAFSGNWAIDWNVLAKALNKARGEA